MSLLADAEFAAIREALEITLTHRYTRTTMTGGTEDDWGDEAPVPSGASDYGVVCRYETQTRVVRDEAGVSTISVPTLTVSAADPLTVGDTIGSVRDQLGGTLVAGPLRVERLIDDTSGLGASLLRTFELRSVQATR